MGGILRMVGAGEFEEISGLFSGTFGFFMAFVLAFTYAVVGSIAAAILSWLYNLFASLVGGIRITLEPESKAPPIQRERALSPSPPPASPQSLST